MSNRNDEKKVHTLTDEELENVCGGIASKHGTACPHCGKFIPLSILDLIRDKHLRCPYCLMTMTISEEALDALKRKS